MIQNAKTALLNMLTPFKIRMIATQWDIQFIAAEISPSALQYLASLPQVNSIEEDRLMKPVDTETNNVIDAPEAWALGYTGVGQTIAILDTGIQSNHPFLTGKVVDEACYSDMNCPNGQSSQVGTGAGSPCSLAGCEHGTHVAGIAAGLGGGSTGVTYSGVAKSATLISIRVFTDTGNGDMCAFAITDGIVTYSPSLPRRHAEGASQATNV
jgi:subtilisin